MRRFETAIANVREGVRTGNVRGRRQAAPGVGGEKAEKCRRRALTNKRLFETIAAMTAALPAVEPTTRDAILDAAERQFAERGFDGASVREIAAEAGLRNQASLYHYFEHKQALYEAVLRRGVGLLVDVVVQSRGLGSLTAYLDRVLDYLVAHPDLAVLMQRVSLDDSEAARAIVSRVVRPLFGEGLRLLGDARRGWADDELPHLAAGLYHLIFGYFADAALLRAVMADEPMSARAIVRQRQFVHTAVARLLGGDDEGART